MNSLYGYYRNKKFTDIFPDFNSFKTTYAESAFAGLKNNVLDEDALMTTYFLLYSQYGNNIIASSDQTQFIYQIFSTMFKYGPTWYRELEIQQKLRQLSEEELMQGSKAIYNHAYNPSSEPSTSSLEELNYINDQNTTNFKKSRLEAYNMLTGLLATDVTDLYIKKFKNYFLLIVEPERPAWYVTDDEEEN